MQIPDIEREIYRAIEKEITIYPCHANRASEIGHPCIRYLVFLRTRWQEQQLPSVERQMIFRHGRIYEDIAKDYLTKAGYEIVEQARPFVWKKYNITGRIDFKIYKKGVFRHPIVVEVKGLQPYDFDSISCIEDFLNHNHHWIQKYPAQLITYLLQDATNEFGLFLLINKVTFRPKPIWVNIDYTYGEQLIQRIEQVNKHVDEGTVPEGANNIDICMKCNFLSVCLPEIKGKEIEVIDDEELEAVIAQCEQLKPAASEYEKLNKIWKKKVEGREKIICGKYLVIGKIVRRKGYTVQDSEYWQYKILPVDPQGGQK